MQCVPLNLNNPSTNRLELSRPEGSSLQLVLRANPHCNRLAFLSGVAAATLNKEEGAELDLLTTEARTVLRMDVREELDAISQATRRYHDPIIPATNSALHRQCL